MGFACTSSVIASILLPLAGLSYKNGFARSWLVMGLMVFITTFISIFLLSGNNSSSEILSPQPSVV